MLEVRDEYFAVFAARVLLCGVGQFHGPDREAVEQGPHFRRVIQREHELPAKFAKTLLERLEICGREVVSVQLPCEVRRVEVKKRGRAIKSFKNFFVGQTLDLHSCQSLMGVFKERREFVEIEPRLLNHMPVIGGVSYQTRKGILEDIEVPRRPLDVRQCRRVGGLLEIKRFATHESETEIPDQLFVMQLAGAEEIHELAIQIVQHFDDGGLLVEEHLCAARECLDVGRVFRKYLNDPLCETVFPSNV